MADNLEDGWIKWEGGDCPLPNGVDHEVRFRNGDVTYDDRPETWNWQHDSSLYDIIAYRLVSK